MAVRNGAAQPGTWPLIIFSHASGGHRRAATFLCTHLSSHGYVVAALDHSEVVAVELARRNGESDEQKTARLEAVIANRVPDICFLLDHLFSVAARDSEANFDPARIGIVANRRTLFGGTGSRIRAWTGALPHGRNTEATRGSAAIFGW
jgi:predicted dienelactone hydrolase